MNTAAIGPRKSRISESYLQVQYLEDGQVARGNLFPAVLLPGRLDSISAGPVCGRAASAARRHGDHSAHTGL